MVKVREDYPQDETGEVDARRWLAQIDDVRRNAAAQYRVAGVREVIPLDQQIILNAFSLARDAEKEALAAGTRRRPTSAFLSGLEMAAILAELQLDSPTLAAAIIYRAVREEMLSLQAVEKQLGEEIAGLVSGVLQMAAIANIHHPIRGHVLGQSQTQVDNLRRMLVNMIDDVRVALIKLAERTCVIRDVKDASIERRHRVAREVFDVYAPLAHRLGIGHLKWELEDLSFRYLHESAYKKIAKLLDERRMDRQRYIEQAVAQLQEELQQHGIHAHLTGRAKHIYSIWRKMQRKGIDFSQVYDIRAMRVLVDEVRDCYAALGVVHSLWRHIPREFDDYIASPKPNGYQSLHTAVVGPAGRVIEIQIRTRKMHDEAELGVCAHWLYKGTDTRKKSEGYEQKIAWLRNVLEWQDELGGLDQDYLSYLRSAITSDRVYLFTPEGHVVDLPQGATPLDFAYKIHTEIGHCCRGAKVNGRIVPLTYVLQTGEQVEILTSPQARPSRDWLNSDLGYIITSRARTKINHWFRQQDREENVHEGRELLLGTLRRLSLKIEHWDALLEQLKYAEQDDLFAAIGAGDLKPMQVIHAAQALQEASEAQLSLALPEADGDGRHRETPLRLRGTSRQREPAGSGITVQGVGNLLTQFAQCCRPVPGDEIIGYITSGRGVSVHRKDCLNVLQLQSSEPNRIIEVSWGDQQETYPVEILVEAYDRSGLLRDITQLLANERINVIAASTRTNKAEHIASLRLTLELASLSAMSRLFDRLRQLPNVIDVSRYGSAGPGSAHEDEHV